MNVFPAKHLVRYGPMGSNVISRKAIMFYIRTYTEWDRNSSVERATPYQLQDPGIEFWLRVGVGDEIFRTRTNHPVGSLYRGQSGRGVALTTHPHLAPRVKKGYSYTSTPPMGLRSFLLTTKSQEHHWPIETTQR
jgi:hypothetical protein